MGQQPSQPSKVSERINEINAQRRQAEELLRALRKALAAEKVAGLPAAPGSVQARYQAIRDYDDRLFAEQMALFDFWNAQRQGHSVAMPEPTPPLSLSMPAPPEAQAAPAPAPPACAAQPSTPVGGASPQRGDSSSSEEEAHPLLDPAARPPGDAERSEVMPPHAAETEGLGSVLRRRQGRHEGC